MNATILPPLDSVAYLLTFDMTMLSSIPPVFPIRMQPGLIPPTVAGPMRPTLQEYDVIDE